MERILSDFRRHRAGMLLICTVIAVGFTAGAWLILLLSDVWADWLKTVWTWAAAVLSAAMALLLAKAFWEMLHLAPKKLAAQLSAMPEQEREAVISAYPEAKTLGERWFLPEHILFYTARRAVILRYDAIKTVSPQNGDLRLGTTTGDIVMPVKAGENAAIIYALLHSRNPALKADFDAPPKKKGHKSQ
ncbi:MAG: hypothetical protein ACI4WS_14840 [Oscillospiraceae bacterium]